MAESKHTPGPWLVVKCDGGFRAFDTDDWTIIGQNKIVPALVWGGVAFEEGKANARLIAAAPDLYEALSEMVTRYEAKADMSDVEAIEWHRRARAALAKVSSSQAKQE